MVTAVIVNMPALVLGLPPLANISSIRFSRTILVIYPSF
jgi:energy-converting hydrogenase Eha subunit A